MRLPGIFFVALCLLTPALTGGCAGTPPTRSYVLDPVSMSPIEGADSGEAVAVSVGPVTIPAYLDRPQIVTRKGQNQVQIAPSDRWAESLQAGISRVLIENLFSLLGDSNVSVHAWSGGHPFEYRVVVDVLHLDGQRTGELVLKAQWGIACERQGGHMSSNTARITVHVGNEEYKDFAAAASEALGKLSKLIASDLVNVLRDQE